MVLCFEKTLETIVNSEDEVRIAIEQLRDDNETLKDKLDIPKEDLDAVSPVIEQQLDPESYESTSYSIDVGYGASTYDGQKTYYELVKGEDESIGASFTEIMSEYQHDLLEQGQGIQDSTRAGDGANHPFVEAQIDTNLKYAKEQINLVSPALWKVMYYGKLKFN